MATRTRVIEKTDEELPKCLCGCGFEVTKRYLPGHDQRHRGQLLRALDSGDQAAGTKLIELGWNTRQQLDERAAKAVEKLAAKLTKSEAKAKKVEPVEVEAQ